MGNCLNRGLSRITRITRIMGLGDGGQESGIGVPSYQVRKSRAYKALPQESSLLPSQKESGLQSPPTREFPPTKSERVGLTKPSHKRVPSYKERVGLTKPSHKRVPSYKESVGLTKPSHKRVPSYQVRKRRAYKALPQESSLLPSQKASGLQSPPTREFPPTKSESVGLTKPSHKRVPSYQVRKRRAYKALPQESSLLPSQKESGLQSPPTREFPPTKKASGLQSPPTREFPPTEEGLTENPRRGFPTPFNLFVNITGIYKIIESFTIARLETSPAFEEFMSFCRARRLGCRWFW